MTNEEQWTELLNPCKCEARYTIEPHGDGHVLYYGRCGHRHGWNLVYLNEPALNCDFAHIEKFLFFNMLNGPEGLNHGRTATRNNQILDLGHIQIQLFL